MRKLKKIGAGFGIGLGAWGLLYELGLTAGSFDYERRRVLPGDDLVPEPHIVTDHAVSINAPPDQVWPWLVQMGWHRGGWYTYRWVDKLLFPNNAASADVILPQYLGLTVGDTIPDGPPESGCYFTVRLLEPGKLLVLVSETHLPAGLNGRPGVELRWSWTFAIEPEGYQGTRFQFRSRVCLEPWWLRMAYKLLVVPADFVMGLGMCDGLKRRVEQQVRRSQTGLPRPAPSVART